ncbi:hypothetical protein QQX98_003122 [Neonectria punicea]|uniref:Uncharacterized protein n=1 Tax=Neonectria punicea TaxID=979145 RepID=A0ABR1HFP7_9HYPO
MAISDEAGAGQEYEEAVDGVECSRDLTETERLLVEQRATELGLAEVVELLLKSTDVNVNEMDNDGRTPLSWTAMWKHKPAKKATPRKANTMDYWNILELLIENNGIDVNSKDVNGWTPLSWAAKNGQSLVLQFLLGVDGLEVNSKDNDGRTALSLAAEHGARSCILDLVGNASIDLNFRDNDGQTPLCWVGL